jgi:hypothetical protein
MAAVLYSSGINTSSGGRLNRTTAGGTGSYFITYIGPQTNLDGTMAGSELNYTVPGVGNYSADFGGTWRFMGAHTGVNGGFQLWTRIS